MFDHMPLMLAQTNEPPTGTGDTGTATTTTSEGADGTPDQSTNDNARQGQGFDPMFLILMFGAIVLFMIFTTRTQRAERKKREAMLASIKKGDKVQTLGGILGTVLEVREKEIILKVDESTNTKMRFARSGIQTVLEDKE